MTLLTDVQVETASEDDLLETLHAVRSRLFDISQERVLAVAAETVAKNGADHVVRITFGVDEWDDGYFFAGIREVRAVSGNVTGLSDRLEAVLEKALDEPLTALAKDHGGVGRFHTAVIDLVRGVVAI